MTDSVAKKITPVSSVEIKPKEPHSKQEKDLPTSCEDLALWINDKLTTPAMTQTSKTTSEDNTETKFIHELNKLTQYMSTHPKEFEAMFNKLPQNIKNKST